MKLPSDPWARAAVILWGLLALAYVVKIVNEGDSKSVYPIFETASHHWWQEQNLWARYEGIDLFRYSPTFAILLTPFALLPTEVGSVLWAWFGIALLVIALRVLVRELFPGEWDARREGMFFVWAVAGSVRGMWAAQSNAHILALAIFAAAAILKARFWPAAAMLATATFVKLWPMALWMLLATRWPRALIGRYLVVCAGLGLVPFLTASASWVTTAYRQYAESLVETSTLRWPGNRDAWTIWETLGPVHHGGYLVLQLVSAMGVLAWCLWQWRRNTSVRQWVLLTLAVWVGWQLLFGPGTERLTYGLIAPFTSWAVLVRSGSAFEHRLAWASWWLTAILGTGAVERALLPVFPAAPAIQPFGVVVFLVWLGLYGRRDVAEATEDRPPSPRPETVNEPA